MHRYRARLSMSRQGGYERLSLGYHPSVDAISIRLNATGDILVSRGRRGPGQDSQHRQGPTKGWWIPTDDGVTVVDNGAASRCSKGLMTTGQLRLAIPEAVNRVVQTRVQLN